MHCELVALLHSKQVSVVLVFANGPLGGDF